jgi:hypothetical protein
MLIGGMVGILIGLLSGMITLVVLSPMFSNKGYVPAGKKIPIAAAQLLALPVCGDLRALSCNRPARCNRTLGLDRTDLARAAP